MSTLWKVEWDRITARIESLIEANRIIGDNTSYTGATAFLGVQLMESVTLMKEFFDRHKGLPSSASERLAAAVRDHMLLTHATKMELVRSRLAIVVALRAELQWLLNDSEQHLISIAERAFLHLSRRLVADESVQSKWLDAYKDTARAETSCEKLGAAHLLLHGVYAFKAHGEGARTDLVLGNELVWSDSLARAVEGLVLTEWKVVRDPKRAAEIAEGARGQANAYKQGVLGGVELGSVRYIVLVSEKGLPTIDDKPTDSGALYRHINIAIKPGTPSTQ